jgi:hypothetical protein
MTPNEKLVAALREAGAPIQMIDRAAAGYYGDFTSSLAFPITELVNDCMALGLTAVADRARNGEFDG